MEILWRLFINGLLVFGHISYRFCFAAYSMFARPPITWCLCVHSNVVIEQRSLNGTQGLKMARLINLVNEQANPKSTFWELFKMLLNFKKDFSLLI